jgi:hypothetical protein
MNDLQHIYEEQYGPVLVTLNPPMEPLKHKTIGRYRYDHPVLDREVQYPPGPLGAFSEIATCRLFARRKRWYQFKANEVYPLLELGSVMGSMKMVLLLGSVLLWITSPMFNRLLTSDTPSENQKLSLLHYSLMSWSDQAPEQSLECSWPFGLGSAEACLDFSLTSVILRNRWLQEESESINVQVHTSNVTASSGAFVCDTDQ